MTCDCPRTGNHTGCYNVYSCSDSLFTYLTYINTEDGTAIGTQESAILWLMSSIVLSVCVADSDYTALQLTTITFPAGETEIIIDVATINDNIAETAEFFRAVLTNPSLGLIIAGGDATINIADNDGRQ